MREPVQNLNTSDITSDVFVVAPTQIEYIAQIFADSVADAMNMRTFAPKIRQIASQSLRTALSAARHAGEKRWFPRATGRAAIINFVIPWLDHGI